MSAGSAYLFGEFRLIQGDRKLLRGKNAISLPPRTFEILCYLVERHGHVVRRGDLMDAVWEGVAVCDNALSQHVRSLRRSLGDTRGQPRYIRTVSRVGYEFIEPVERLTSGELRPIHALAVLPCLNLGGADDAYFADGMTDALITELARIRGLRVISRTSVMRYKGLSVSVPEIGRRLGVDAVVEGSAMRAGDRVRITAQLIDSRTDEHLWADAFESSLTDLIALQREISRNVAERIGVELAPRRPPQKGGAGAEGYDAYLRGLYCLNRRSAASLRQALDHFREAVARAPSYAPAHAALADCYNLLANYDVWAPCECIPEAKISAQRALSLDPDLAEAHAALAFTTIHHDWDGPAAERLFLRALAVNPGYPHAHHWYALGLAMEGRFEEALSRMQRARSLDPASPIAEANLGWILYVARRFGESTVQLRTALGMDPDFLPARVKLAWACLEDGAEDEAVSLLEENRRRAGDGAAALLLAHALAVSGARRKAIRELERGERRAGTEYLSPYLRGLVLAALDDLDGACAEMERAVVERCAWMAWARVDPKLDALREMSRFRGLIARLGPIEVELALKTSALEAVCGQRGRTD